MIYVIMNVITYKLIVIYQCYITMELIKMELITFYLYCKNMTFNSERVWDFISF